MKKWSVIFLTMIFIVAIPIHSMAAKRVALVIGNSAYEYTRVLANPARDARAIGALLKEIGFSDVSVKFDLKYGAMRKALRDFSRRARRADLALVYYAGHGLELGGENYLVPVDAALETDADLEYEAVTLASVLGAVKGARSLRFVILDACRNNPLSQKIALAGGVTRSVSRGLGRIEPTGDVLVAYAAKADTVALDGDGEHSPYAAALLKHFKTPGLDIRRVMGLVRD